MFAGKRLQTPSYRLHKSTGQAIVVLDGKMFYLGLHGSEPSKRQYDQLITQWLANGRHLPTSATGSAMTVGELVLRFWDFAQGDYRKNGEPTSELSYPFSVHPGRYCRLSNSFALSQLVTRPAAASYSIFWPTR